MTRCEALSYEGLQGPFHGRVLGLFLRLEAFHITRREAKDVGKAGASGCAAPTALGAKKTKQQPLWHELKKEKERENGKK